MQKKNHIICYVPYHIDSSRTALFLCTGWPGIRGRVFLVPCKKWLAQCTGVQYSTIQSRYKDTITTLPCLSRRVVPCIKWPVQWMLLYTRILDVEKSLFTRYQNHTAMYTWSSCISLNIMYTINSILSVTHEARFKTVKGQAIDGKEGCGPEGGGDILP